MSDTLERFHNVLVREIRRNHPEYLEAPFTVAEIYQNLVPYRTHRDSLGVEMNGDYEHALLRLLGGEGGYLELESEVALREIKDELEHPNPNTGLFRDFAAADVRLTEAHEEVPADEEGLDDGDRDDAGAEERSEPEAVADTGAGASGEADDEVDDEVEQTRQLADLLAEADERMQEITENAGEDGAPASGEDGDADEATGQGEPGEEEFVMTPGEDAPRRLFVMGDGEADGEVGEVVSEFAPDDPTVHAFGGDEEAEGGDEDAEGSAGADEPGAEPETDNCHWCRADLPDRAVLNFCPYCGSDLRMKPCAECGEELESGWMFCPACGTEAAH